MNVYSFNGTLYTGNVSKDFYKFIAKKYKKVSKYTFNNIFKSNFKENGYKYLKEIEDVDKEVELFWEEHFKNIKNWTPDWRLDDDVLMTSAPEFLVAPVAEKMKFSLLGTKVDKKTGQINGEILTGEEKLKAFRKTYGSKVIVRYFAGSNADTAIAKIAERAYIIEKDRPVLWSNLGGKKKKPSKKQLREYKKVCEFETYSFYKKFLPYCKGTPEKYPTYSERLTDQYNRVNLLLFSDSHADGFGGLKNFKDTIDFANNAPIKYDAVINAGDIITPVGKPEKAVAYKAAKRVFKLAKKCNAPFIFSKGNHDLNDWVNYPDRVLNTNDWNELFYDYAEKKYGFVRQTKKNGEKSTWHYYDIEDKKIRIVAVDIQDTAKDIVDEKGFCKMYGGKSWYISNEQMNWIIDTAFNFDDKAEKDWGIVIVQHQYSDSRFHQNACDVLVDVCAALNEQATYSHSYKHPEYNFFDMEVSADFTRYEKEERKPHVICWLMGHDHERKHEIKKGINLIWTIHGIGTPYSSDPRIVRISGTSTQNSFDVVNIDTFHRKIRIFAYGAQTTCYGDEGDRFLPDGLSY